MEFTDEELRELEDDLAGCQKWSTTPINVLGIRALVARLRAAEKVCKIASYNNLSVFTQSLARWRNTIKNTEPAEGASRTVNK